MFMTAKTDQQEKGIEKQKEEIKEKESKIRDLNKQVRELRIKNKEKHQMAVKVLKNEMNVFKKQTRHQIATLVTSAFGFVAALFWRDAIKAFIEQAFNITVGAGESWFVQVIIALVITIFAAAVIYYISKLDAGS